MTLSVFTRSACLFVVGIGTLYSKRFLEASHRALEEPCPNLHFLIHPRNIRKKRRKFAGNNLRNSSYIRVSPKLNYIFSIKLLAFVVLEHVLCFYNQLPILPTVYIYMQTNFHLRS